MAKCKYPMPSWQACRSDAGPLDPYVCDRHAKAPKPLKLFGIDAPENWKGLVVGDVVEVGFGDAVAITLLCPEDAGQIEHKAGVLIIKPRSECSCEDADAILETKRDGASPKELVDLGLAWEEDLKAFEERAKAQKESDERRRYEELKAKFEKGATT